MHNSKWKLLLIVLGMLFTVSSVFAVISTVDLSLRNVTLKQFIEIIEDKTEFTFMLDNTVDLTQRITVNSTEEGVETLLKEAFLNKNLKYEISGRQIILKTTSPITNQDPARRLSGVVYDETGTPVAGANVVQKGTTNGTITDLDGKFILEVSQGATLLVTYIGYVPKEVVVRNFSNLRIDLQEDSRALDEIVVVGYGIQKKENLTGAVDAVKGEKLSSRTAASTSQTLQGLSPGTTIINTGGAPGADGATIRIRGVGTFNNADPLIIVDGVNVSNIDNIDPQDIDNISILKDAASSAIYGSRAANGVILITTKRGSNDGKVSVRYNGYVGWQSITREPDWVSAHDYMMLLNESMVNANKVPKYSDEQLQKAGTDPYYYPDTDWWGILFNPALQHRHTVSINAGTEKVKTAISVNYLNREGILISTNSSQYGIRANNDIKLHDKLNVGIDFNFNVRERDQSSRIGDVYWNFMGHDIPVTLASRDPDGGYPLGTTNRNPLATANEAGYDKYKNYQVIVSPSFKYQVTKDLSLSGRATIKADPDTRKRYYNGYEFKDYLTKQVVLTWYNSLDQYANSNTYTNWQGVVDYEKAFGDHFVHALVGYSQEYNHRSEIMGSRRNFYSNDLQELTQGSDEGKNATGTGNEWALRSLFGRLNYSFKDRYLFEANFRYDGSSRFAQGLRYGFFPSFSGAWRISEEDFLKGNDNIGNMKLRASWGKLGNQEIDLYQYIHTINLGQNYAFNGQLAEGAAQVALANELISWETTTTFDAGFDLGLWKNKLTLTADYYVRNTDNILLRRDIPATVGLTAPVQNVGAVRNTGWELALTYQNKLGDLQYSVSATLSDVHNVIKRYGEKQVDGWFVNEEGESIRSLYGYVAEGIFQTEDEVKNHAYQASMTGPGDIIYKDQNNDGILNSDDKVVLGSTIPRYTYGLTLNGRFKGFDLTVFFNGVGKANGYQYGALIEGPIWDGNTISDMLDRWTPENKNASWPRLVYQTIHNQEASNFWIQNTSYLRLKNAQIGYTLPKSVLNVVHLKNVRVYVSGDNLLTVTKAKNLDPEYTSGRGNFFPQTKILSMGIDVTF